MFRGPGKLRGKYEAVASADHASLADAADAPRPRKTKNLVPSRLRKKKTRPPPAEEIFVLDTFVPLPSSASADATARETQDSSADEGAAAGLLLSACGGACAVPAPAPTERVRTLQRQLGDLRMRMRSMERDAERAREEKAGAARQLERLIDASRAQRALDHMVLEEVRTILTMDDAEEPAGSESPSACRFYERICWCTDE